MGPVSDRRVRGRSAMTVHPIAKRRVLVVGASAGIGRAFAAEAIAGGAAVVAVARRGDRLAELAEGGSCTPVVVDIARAPDIDRLVEELASLGTFDLVLFSAGARRCVAWRTPPRRTGMR